MKNLWFLVLLFTSLFARERHLVPNPYGNDLAQVNFPEEEIGELQVKTRFFYLSGGMTYVFPTVTLGYRQTYSAFASDFSLSGVSGKIPFLQFKQLISFSGTWTKGFIAYMGPKLGAYLTGSGIFDVGGIIGLQFNHPKLCQFLEMGVGSHFQGTSGRSIWGMPSFSYGLLF